MGNYERAVIESVVCELAARGGLDITPAAACTMSDDDLINFVITFFD